MVLLLQSGVNLMKNKINDKYINTIIILIIFSLFLTLVQIGGNSISFNQTNIILGLVATLFLYQIILFWGVKSYKQSFILILLTYLFIPFFILFITFISKLFDLNDIFISNSFNYNLIVFGLSFICADLISKVKWSNNTCYQKSRAWVELDMKAFDNNINVLKSKINNDCNIMGVIKANAYGHGDVIIAKALNKNGIRFFCVATIFEAIKLRKDKIKGEILVFGYTSTELFYLLKKYDLTQSIMDYEYAIKLNDYNKNIKVHLALDTGMHRVGINCDNFDDIKAIFKLKKLKVTGIYTHLCASDSQALSNRKFSIDQCDKIIGISDRLKELNFKFKLHIISTCGLINYPDYAMDYVRIGIALFGVTSKQDDMTPDYDLHPVLSLKARVISIKNLKFNEGAGYSWDFIAQKPSVIATVSIGYADGISRSLSKNGYVLINGKKAKIVGKMCMDLMLVDVSGIDVNIFDIVTLIGKDEDLQISVFDIANQTNTITIETVSALSDRLERVIK